MVEVNYTKPVIWLIDDNKYELRTHYNIFKRMLPTSLQIKTIEAYQHLDDYLSVLADENTACIVTDQKLKVTGIANYTGIELAEFLRGINAKVPIYILTNFPDDRDEFENGEWTVEDIISKSDLTQESERKILAARILRRINIYNDIKDERQEKMYNLLKKSMNGELDEEELSEIDNLKLEKTSASLAQELTQIRQMEQIARAHEELIKQFKRSTQ
jgi:FixJ family two-component response regulator